MNRKVKTPLPEAPPAELDSQAMLDLASHTDSDAGAAAEALVKKARRGDEAAFGALVETYERFVYHTALRVLRMCGGRAEDGEDVAQDAFMKAWRSLDSFRGGCAFSTWLYRITVNCARDTVRSAARHPTVSITKTDGDGEEAEWDLPETNTELLPEDVKAAAQAALDSMVAAPNTVDFSGVELK